MSKMHIQSTLININFSKIWQKINLLKISLVFNETHLLGKKKKIDTLLARECRSFYTKMFVTNYYLQYLFSKTKQQQTTVCKKTKKTKQTNKNQNQTKTKIRQLLFNFHFVLDFKKWPSLKPRSCVTINTSF